MTTPSKNKWNQVYAKAGEPGPVAAVLRDNKSLISAFNQQTGKALDIACGRGGNALFLAEQGFAVEAWDISDVVIADLKERTSALPVTPRVLDIEPDAFKNRAFDIIVNCHYLDRQIIPAMLDSLVPGGLLFFQTFVKNRVVPSGPSNPDFLLSDGELLEMSNGMEVLAYRDGASIADENDPIAGRAYIVARKAATP